MNMLLGEKLKKARKNIGMSQNEVAEELMLSRQTISKWENNVCLPDLENFQRICKLYKVDFNTILSKDEGKIIYNIDKSEKEEEDTKEIDKIQTLFNSIFFPEGSIGQKAEKACM